MNRALSLTLSVLTATALPTGPAHAIVAYEPAPPAALFLLRDGSTDTNSP